MVKKKVWKNTDLIYPLPSPPYKREKWKTGLWNVMSKFEELVRHRAEVSASQTITDKEQFLVFKNVFYPL